MSAACSSSAGSSLTRMRSLFGFDVAAASVALVPSMGSDSSFTPERLAAGVGQLQGERGENSKMASCHFCPGMGLNQKG